MACFVFGCLGCCGVVLIGRSQTLPGTPGDAASAHLIFFSFLVVPRTEFPCETSPVFLGSGDWPQACCVVGDVHVPFSGHSTVFLCRSAFAVLDYKEARLLV